MFDFPKTTLKIARLSLGNIPYYAFRKKTDKEKKNK